MTGSGGVVTKMEIIWRNSWRARAIIGRCAQCPVIYSDSGVRIKDDPHYVDSAATLSLKSSQVKVGCGRRDERDEKDEGMRSPKGKSTTDMFAAHASAAARLSSIQ